MAQAAESTPAAGKAKSVIYLCTKNNICIRVGIFGDHLRSFMNFK